MIKLANHWYPNRTYGWYARDCACVFGIVKNKTTPHTGNHIEYILERWALNVERLCASLITLYIIHMDTNPDCLFCFHLLIALSVVFPFIYIFVARFRFFVRPLFVDAIILSVLSFAVELDRLLFVLNVDYVETVTDYILKLLLMMLIFISKLQFKLSSNAYNLAHLNNSVYLYMFSLLPKL